MDCLGRGVWKLLRSGKQHLTLVGEVPEERASGQPGMFCDIRRRHVLVAAFQVQVERGLPESSFCPGLPSRHSSTVDDDGTPCHHMLWCTDGDRKSTRLNSS